MEEHNGPELYESLYDALDKAAEQEAWLESHIKGLRHTNLANEPLQRAAQLTDKDLPAAMGKLISTLDLQSPFQSLGRYVRSFADAAFVIRGLKALLVERAAAHSIVVDAVIVWCTEYAKLITSLKLS